MYVNLDEKWSVKPVRVVAIKKEKMFRFKAKQTCTLWME